jgi:hypothetical protein
MKNPETTARVQERLIERLRIEPCDSDAPLPTCRENWPNGPDSWCDGCLMLAAADAVDASQARAAALAQERDETFEAMREMTNAAHDFADKADASQATLAQVTAERDEALQCQHAYDAVTRAIAEAVGDGDPSGPYWPDGVRWLQQRAEVAEEKVRALEAALRKYGEHDGTCSAWTSNPYVCSCGLDKLLSPSPDTGKETQP